MPVAQLSNAEDLCARVRGLLDFICFGRGHWCRPVFPIVERTVEVGTLYEGPIIRSRLLVQVSRDNVSGTLALLAFCGNLREEVILPDMGGDGSVALHLARLLDDGVLVRRIGVSEVRTTRHQRLSVNGEDLAVVPAQRCSLALEKL